MTEYEKPVMEIVEIGGDVVTMSDCDFETPIA